MTKLTIHFNDGSEYEIDLNVVAEHRALAYAKDGDTIDQETYEEELRNGLSDTVMMKDWIMGDMYWDDVEPYLTRVKDPTKLEYDDEFNHNRFSVRVVK